MGNFEIASEKSRDFSISLRNSLEDSSRIFQGVSYGIRSDVSSNIFPEIPS